MITKRDIRLWVAPFDDVSAELVLSAEQAHYVGNVMRCAQGEQLRVFNDVNGEFWGEITLLSKNKLNIRLMEKIRNPESSRDVWLLFAPLKKDKTDFVIEKATELGVKKIIPVITERTNVNQVKTQRYRLQAIEAAEQCGRLDIPEIGESTNLNALLGNWDGERIIYFADERRQGLSPIKCFDGDNTKVALLIGPEGGFSESEANFINMQKFTRNINLGSRILRAETAAVAALAVWQAIAGDWNNQ